MNRPWFKFYEDGVPHSIALPDKTLGQIWDESAAAHGQRMAVWYFGRKLTYAQLGKLVDQFATALARLGVRQGDRVAVILPNIPQYPVVHFAALKLGAVLVPTNPLYVEREIKFQLNNSEAETVVTLDFLYPKIERIWGETGVRNVVVTEAQAYLPALLRWLYPFKARRQGNWFKVPRRPGVHFFRELVREPFPESAPRPEVKPDDVAMFLYTGGTTGVSKGAILTHRNLVANVHQIEAWFNRDRTGREVLICALPFFHSYGLTTGLHMGVLIGATMVLIPNPRDIKAILKAIQRNRATIFSAVPTLYVAINHHPDVHRYDLSTVKACVSGGAPLPLEVARQFEAMSQGRLVEGYGLSETSPVTHTNPIHGLRKEGSIGIPVPNTDAKIVDPETKETVPVGEVGELAVKGPQVMRGYWKMQPETDEILRDGWLFTGDMARMDEDGYFYIVDRKKEMIIAGGYNIFPREVEEVLYEHPAVQEAAVIGVPDEYRGETVKAVVVRKPGADLDEPTLIAFCKERLAKYKVPKLVEFRDTLPKSNIGKVLKRVLVEEEVKKRKASSEIK